MLKLSPTDENCFGLKESVFNDSLEAGTDVEEGAIVLVVVDVRVGGPTVVLYVIPLVRVLLGIQLLVGHRALDTDAALNNLPTLRIVLHERLTVAGVEVATRKLYMVGRLGIALLEAECIVLAELLVDGVALECEDLVAGRHLDC